MKQAVDSLTITLDASKSDALVHLPEDVALLHAAYQAGVTTGREEGYMVGYEVGRTDGGRGQAAGTTEERRADRGNKGGPARMLLGLPCPNCRCYFSADDARCPYCKRPQVTSAALTAATRLG